MAWPSDYPGYISLTVATAQVTGGPHAGFVALITEAAFAGLAAADNPLDTSAGRSSANGSDLVVSDANDNRMALDIVSWAPLPGGGTCELWVRERPVATFQPSDAGAVTLRVWFDSAVLESQPLPGEPYGRHEVWGDKAVAWRPEDTLENRVDGVFANTFQYLEPDQPLVYVNDAKIGQKSLQGSWANSSGGPGVDWKTVLPSASPNADEATIRLWVKYDRTNGSPIGFGASTHAEEQWNASAGTVRTNVGRNVNQPTTVSVPPFNTTFVRFAWTMSTTNAANEYRFYANDNLALSTTLDSASIWLRNRTLGDTWIGGTATYNLFIVELGVARSKAFLDTEFNNQNNPGAFWTPGAFVETGGSVTGTATASTGPASVAASGAHGVSGTSAASSGAAQVQASGAVSDPESTAGIGAAVTARARTQAWGLVTTPPDYRDIGDAFILEVGVPYSVNSIINGALDLIASNGIASLSDSSSHVGNAIKRNFDVERDSLLREYPWNFAMRRAKLAASSEAPAFRFRRAYELPAGPKPEFCLRVWAVGDDDSRNDTGVWEISGRRLLTDLEAPLPVRYIGRIVNPALWDPLTVKALEARLAWQAAYMASGSAALAEQMARIYQERLDAAKAIDAQEGTPEPFEDGTTWVDSRLTGASW